MKDVALKAGVSISTVSHVINKTRFVERKTADRILKVIADLDYKPNIMARSLRGKGTKTIGIIISDIRDSFFSDAVKAIESHANKKGYTVILCDAEGNIEKENSYIDILLHKGIDGLILAPVDMNGPDKDFLKKSIPTVQIDRKMKNLKSDFVGIDNVKSAEKATYHLMDHGYKNIGFIGYEKRFYSLEKRFEGYRNAVKNRGFPVKFLITTKSHGGTIIKDEIKNWLSKEKIDAVLCGNDDICYETLVAIKELGLEIPGNIGIITFDDVKWFNYLKDPITSIYQPAEEIGGLAIDLLIDRIRHKMENNFKDLLLETKFIVRGSCGEKV